MTGSEVAGETVWLRPFEVDEPLPDDGSTWDDWGDGPRVGPPPELERLVVMAGDTVVGVVSWHAVGYGASRGSRAWNMGIGLLEEHRGRGIGSVAQRLLAERLLRTTDEFRIEASTDVANIAEQRSLEKAGFRREGVIRQAQERRDGRHDLVSYSLLRSDLEASATQPVTSSS